MTRPDPQISQQSTPSFTAQQLIDNQGPAANENNLDKISGVRPLRTADIEALVGKTVCALVWDSDISYDWSDNYAVLKGATMGLTAFRVASTTPRTGSSLPYITVDLLASSEIAGVCDNTEPGVTTSAESLVFIRR